jgi:prolyl oligopeptidase
MSLVQQAPPPAPAYPAVRRDESVRTSLHGGKFVVADPYRALESPDSDETKAFVAAQQATTDAYLASPALAPARAQLRARLEALYNYSRSSAPWVRGGRGYVYRNTGLQNQDVLFKLPAPPAAGAAPAAVDDVFEGGEPLLDLNALFPDGTTSLSTSAFSEDGRLWAYALSKSGSDWVTIRVKDVASGADLPDEVPNVKFSGITWLHDRSGFFYSRYPAAPEVSAGADAGTETSRNEFAFVCFHRLGSPASEDVLVWASPYQPNWRGGVGLTDDGAYLTLHVSKGTDPVNRLYYCHLPTHWAKWLARDAPRLCSCRVR